MSLAEEMLATMPLSDDSSTYSSDEEPHIVINESRQAIVPNELKTIAVTGDKDIETVTFDCVRFWDEHDLSTFAIYINYVLPNLTKGTYTPSSVYVDANDSRIIHFDWEIKNYMTQVSGGIVFAVSAIKTDSEGNIEYRWSSLQNSDFFVAEGIDISEPPNNIETSTILAQMSEILTQLQQGILTPLKKVLGVVSPIDYIELDTNANTVTLPKGFHVVVENSSITYASGLTEPVTLALLTAADSNINLLLYDSLTNTYFIAKYWQLNSIDFTTTYYVCTINAAILSNDKIPHIDIGIPYKVDGVIYGGSSRFNVHSDVAAEHGISSVIASGTVKAVSPAYVDTTIANGITLKKGKGYRFSASVDRGTTTAKTVWVSLKDASGNQLKSITLSTSVDTSSLDFSLTTDYNDAYISFKTEVTNGYTVSANLELTAEGGSERYSPNTEFISDDFVNGDATFWNGGATINYGAKYRVTCTLGTMYKYAQDVHIKAADGFKFVIGYYNDGACTSESGWQSEITVPANQQFRIMIQRATPNTSEVADVAEFVSKLSIYTNVLKEIYDLANKNNTQEETTNVAENPCACVKPFEVLSISHRGYNRVAPENTLAAYKLSKKNGFDFVECDVRFTSDGVPVLLHDASINRTARNADGSEISSTINIADITYETALTYDFGIWKGEEYAGTKIPTLAEFMQLCRALSLYPYLDLYEAYSATQAQAICDVIKSCGMERNVTFISASSGIWNYMSNVMPEARYGLVSWEADPTTGTNIADYIDTLRAKGVKNIFAMGDRNIMDTSLFIAMCKEKGVSLEIYSLNTEEEILALDPFISGIISDTLVAKDVLRYANDEAQIKVGSTTLTETQLIKILKFIESIEEVNE